MTFDSEQATPPQSPNPQPPKLIASPYRLTFVLLFTGLTVGGLWLAGILNGAIAQQLSRSVPATLSDPVTQRPSIWLIILKNLVSGGCMGLGQWLALRKHWSHSLDWVGATSLGFGLSVGLATAWSTAVVEPLALQSGLGWGWLATFLGNLAFIGVGLCQYWILRNAISSGWTWIFVPALSNAIAGLAVAPVFVLLPGLLGSGQFPGLGMAIAGLRIVIVGLIQSLCLCRYNRAL